MVLGTARRLLDDAHAAEDVFQAAFLLLARKKPALRGPGSLAGWLHGVAWRLAMKARTQTGRRRRHETRKAEANAVRSGGGEEDREEEAVTGDEPSELASRREVRRMMEEELGRLPEQYRAALVLCYLEGLTNEEAADRLGWPVGSVKSRLNRGRDMLSARLAGRGLAVAAPLLATALTEGAVEAVSLKLVDTTVQAAAAFAAGQEVGRTGVSVGAIELTRGVLRTMLLHKFKLVGGVVAALVAVATLGAVMFPKAAPNVAQAADEPPAVFAVPAETPQVKADREAVVKGNTAFALDLYKKLAEDKTNENKNLFLSPYSISTALAMTCAGARTETASEMAKALHFPVEQDRLHPAFAGLIGRFQANKEDKGYQLGVANALWGQKDYRWDKDFLRTTQTNYGAGLRSLDFMTDPDGARKTINAWVEEQTKDKIKELLKEGVLKPATRLVLTNAIYFKGDWKDQFDKKATKDEPFFGATEMKAPLMHRTGRYGYTEGDGFQVLELPYRGDELSMVVLLPKKGDGVADLEKKLTTEKLNDCIAKLSSQKVIVSLPKFKVEAGFELAAQLKALGMGLAFDASEHTKADFTGMKQDKSVRDLFISKVIHKAFVDVNEEGTEAAAATAVIIEATIKSVHIEPPTPVFRADHPFLYMIRDQKSGSVLFLGRLNQPN
jgi:serpin B